MKINSFTRFAVTGLFVTLLASSAPRAEDKPATPAMPAPQKEHEWLHQFVGEWESDSTALMGPGQPEMKCKWTIKSRMLGGFWVVSESTGEMMGEPMYALQTIGYDPNKKKYVGTWVDSMTNHMWQYVGTVDPTGKILTLEAEGPNFMKEGKTAMFRDVYEFKSKDQVAVSSLMQEEDGKWTKFMWGDARRKK